MKLSVLLAPIAGAALALLLISSTGHTDGQLGPKGDITAVNAGSGLLGGAAYGPASLAIDPSYTQRRITGTCGAGSAVQAVADDGTVTCGAAGGGGGGVTNIATTAPLAGGPITSTGTISLTTCAVGQVYKMVGGVWTCAADADTTYTAGTGLSLAGTVFSANLAGATCTAGQGVSAISSAGAGTCTADVTAVASGTGISASTVAGTATITANLTGASCAAGTQMSALSATGTGTCSADVTAVASGTGISASTVSGTATITANLAGASCAAGNFMSALSATGTGTCTAETGDISGVTATAPLSGGGTTGAITIGMSNGDRGDITQSQTTTAGDTWTIDNSAVTFAKIANIATSRILGRSTAGSGVIEELTGAQAAAIIGAVTGSGTTDTIPIFTAAGVVGNSTITKSGSTYTVSGTMHASGTLTGGTGVFNGAFDTGISTYGLAFKLATNATADGVINGVGYNEGTTQFRNLRIQDGKGADVITVTGSSKDVALAATMSVAGNTTFNGATNSFGDANSDESYFRTNVYSVTTSSAANKPTISSCGTSPGIVGGSFGFIVTPGTGSPTSCTATFADAFADTPSCVLTATTLSVAGAGLYLSSVSTSAITFTTTTGVALSGGIHVHCVGTSINPGSP